jgi:iron complex outermembrane receptor protein
MAWRISILWLVFSALPWSAIADGGGPDGGGIKDSVFRIKEVAVVSERIFVKEEAGMKQSRVDTVVLRDKANLSLSQLLSENTPVFIKEHGRGALATASFRGTAASHTKVNWNGININNPMAGMVDFSLIPVYIVDDLNLKHGSASLADRSGGLGGSINIENRVDWQNRFGLKYMQGIGSYSTFDEFLSVGFGGTRFQSSTRLYNNYSANDFTFINRGIANIDPETGGISHPLDTNDNADYTRYGILQEFYFRPNMKNRLSLKWWGQAADRSIPRVTSYEGPDNSNLNRQEDIDHKVVADWKHYAASGRLLLRSGYSGKQLDYSLRNQVPGVGLVPAIYSESQQHSFLNTLSYSHDFSAKFSAEAQLDADYHDVVSLDTVSGSGYDRSRAEVSAFLSLRRSFAGRLNLNLMLRQDWIAWERVPFVPYLGFDFRVLPGADLILKGNVARNYKDPSLNSLYWQPGGNPDLQPEEGLSYEVGMEYQAVLGGGAGGKHLLKTELTAYRSDINNWIIWIPSFKGYWEPQNIKRVLARGLEFNAILHGSLGPVSYKTAGNYAYTRSTNYGDPLVWSDESYGKQLPYIPVHSGNVMVNLSYRGFFLTWQHNSYSERYTTSSNDLTRRDWLYPYFMNDLIIGKDFRWNKVSFTAEFKIYNLFDETYHSVLYRPMPGRNYLLMLMIKL